MEHFKLDDQFNIIKRCRKIGFVWAVSVGFFFVYAESHTYSVVKSGSTRVKDELFM